MKSQHRRKKTTHARARYFWIVGVSVAALALPLVIYSRVSVTKAAPPGHVQASGNGTVKFTDAHRQAEEFISFDRSIFLTGEQKKVMEEALSSIAAPCCAQYSIATCCCPCNLARSTWGLSKFLIANQHANVSQVRAAASDWLQFSNPNGFTGDACFTKGCNRSFEKNGCGGMDGRHIE